MIFSSDSMAVRKMVEIQQLEVGYEFSPSRYITAQVICIEGGVI